MRLAILPAVRTIGRLAGVIALCAATTIARSGAADSPADLERAKSLFSAGAEAYAAGKYPVAIQAFEEAHKLAPKPNILFNLAQAERKQYFIDKQPEHLTSALAHYRSYLDQVPSGGRRSDAVDALAELEPLAARLSTASGPPTPPKPPETRLMVTSKTPKATGSLDGGTVVEMPLMEEVKPGPHKVHVTAPGFFPEDRELVAASGTIVTLDLALKEMPGKLSVQAQGGADVYVDGRLVGETPLARPIELPAGSHLVALTKNGARAWSKTVSLERGESKTITAQLLVSGQRTASYWVMGAGIVGLATGGAFVGLSLAQQDKAQALYASSKVGGLGADQLGVYASEVDARDRWRSASIISFGAGGALLLVGGAMWLFDHPSPGSFGPVEVDKKPEKESAPSPLAAVPIVSPGFVGASVTGAF